MIGDLVPRLDDHVIISHGKGIGDLVPRWQCDSFGQNWLCTWGVVALLITTKIVYIERVGHEVRIICVTRQCLLLTHVFICTQVEYYKGYVKRVGDEVRFVCVT